MARRFLLWYGFLGAALAWSLQLVIGYSIEDSACSQGASDSKPWIVIVTLVLGALAAGSLGTAFLTLRGAQSRDVRGGVRFLAVTGLFAGVFFLVLIALGGLQLVALDSCHQG
jgi:hypothetical protein